MFKTLTFSVALLLIIVNKLDAQIGGESVFGFLAIATHAHQQATNNAYNALTNNEFAALELNPSLVNDSARQALSLNYSRFFAQTNMGSVYYKHRKDIPYIIGLQYIGYGEMTRADDLGQIQGHFRAAEYAFSFTYLKTIKQRLQVGITALPVFSFLEHYHSIGLAARLGASYRLANQLQAVGISVLNFGTQLKTYAQSFEPLPLDIQLNYNIKLAYAPFRFTVMMHQLHRWDLQFSLPSFNQVSLLNAEAPEQTGFLSVADEIFRHTVLAAEFVPSGKFYVAFSYNHQRRQEMQLTDRIGFTGMAWGFGLTLNKFHLHVSRSTLMLGQTNTNIGFQLFL